MSTEPKVIESEAAIAAGGRTLHLPDVTLICVDTANPELAMRAIRHSMQLVEFGAAVFVTRPQHGLSDIPASLTLITDQPVRSSAEYSMFMLQRLLPFVQTSHCLVVQWDGFVLDPAMWSDAFLQFDYIGSVWPYYSDGHRVGNGGFSLRSRRLLEALADPEIRHYHPEDRCIARTHRELLEQRHGIRFADEASAHRFANESMFMLPSSFGFHGMINLQRAFSPQEFEDFMAHAPNSLFAAHATRVFIKDALRQGQTALAARALRRRRAVRKTDLGDVRLWLRLYRSRLLDLFRRPPSGVPQFKPTPNVHSRSRGR